VGVVRFTRCEVRIRPKLAGGDIGVLQMLDYASGIQDIRRLAGLRGLPVGGRNLADLICLLLLEECQSVARQGILRDYVLREEALPALRGRFLADRQVRMRYGQLAELECRHDDYEADIVENRLLAGGLECAQRVCGDRSISSRINRMLAHLLEVCGSVRPEDIDAAMDNRLEYHRRNSYYRAAHQWALLLLSRQYVQDLFSEGDPESFAFLLDMNVLFERFMARLLVAGFAGGLVDVELQRSHSSILVDAHTGQPYSSLRPDIVLWWGDRGSRLARPVDTKYKLYDDRRKVDPGDLYQCLLYAYAFNDGAAIADRSAVILFPSAATADCGSVRVLTLRGVPGPSLSLVGVDVPATIARLTSGQPPDPRLLDLVLGVGSTEAAA
jgi:5-methylcytosine-specific restriction enzyme subunit McrC